MKNKYGIITFLILGILISGCKRDTAKLTGKRFEPYESAVVDSVKALDSIANACKAANISMAFQYGRNALTIANRHTCLEARARAYDILAGVSLYDRPDSAYYFLTEAIKIANTLHLSSLKPLIFYQLSEIYSIAFDYKLKVVYLDSALSAGRKDGTYEILANSYIALGNLHSDLQDIPEATSMFDSAYRISIKHNLRKQAGISLGNLGKLEKDFHKSVRIQREAIMLLKDVPGTQEAKALIYINLGYQYREPDSAIVCYLEATRLVDSNSSNYVLIAANNNLASRYILKRRFEEAEHCLRDLAIPVAVKDDNFDWLSTLYDTYSDLNGKAGQIDPPTAGAN